MTTALLVIGCQSFFSAELSAPLPNILSLIASFSASQRSTLTTFTQHGHTADELSGNVPNQVVRRWGPSDSIAIGSSEWQLLPEIQAVVTKDTPISAKNSYDAFVHTGLEERLREWEVERVVVCGCLTDFCCETTAKSAFCRGFETWLVEDACGTASRRGHEAGVRAFEKLCGDAKRTAQVVEWLEGGE